MYKNNNEINEVAKVLFSAIVLDEKSRKKILDKVKEIIPNGWNVELKQVVINNGELSNELKKYEGLNIYMEIIGVGSGKNIRVFKLNLPDKLNKIFNDNKQVPTIILTRKNDSLNTNIDKWIDIKPITITGKIKEITNL